VLLGKKKWLYEESRNWERNVKQKIKISSLLQSMLVMFRFVIYVYFNRKST